MNHDDGGSDDDGSFYLVLLLQPRPENDFDDSNHKKLATFHHSLAALP